MTVSFNPQFGAKANAQQYQQAQDVSQQVLGGQSYARPELTFYHQVDGLRNVFSAQKALETDAETAERTLGELDDKHELPSRGPIDILYLFELGSEAVAKVAAAIAGDALKHRKAEEGEEISLERSGNQILVRNRVQAESLKVENY